MEWCRTRRKGGVSQYLTIQVYDALETLKFGCVFVCKLPIDRRGPITEGIRRRLQTGPDCGIRPHGHEVKRRGTMPLR
jgi:hypothetical protein